MEAMRHSSAYDLLYIEWYLHSQIRLSCRLCHWFLVYWSHLFSVISVDIDKKWSISNIRVKTQFRSIILFSFSGRSSYHKRWLKEFIFNQTTRPTTRKVWPNMFDTVLLNAWAHNMREEMLLFELSMIHLSLAYGFSIYKFISRYKCFIYCIYGVARE